MKNLNNLSDSDHVTITSTPGHAGIHSDEKADIRVSTKCLALDPFIPISYARVRAAVSDWSIKT